MKYLLLIIFFCIILDLEVKSSYNKGLVKGYMIGSGFLTSEKEQKEAYWLGIIAAREQEVIEKLERIEKEQKLRYQ